MVIGFTGTRSGMNEKQKTQLHSIFKEVVEQEFHTELVSIDGGCIGADFEFHRAARDFGFRSICYPGISSKNPGDRSCRADLSGYNEIKPEKTFFARNRQIVDDCDLLIGAPYGMDGKTGGTWYTIEYAKKIGKNLIILER